MGMTLADTSHVIKQNTAPKALFRQAAKIQCFGISDSNPFSCFVCRLNSEKTHMKSDVYKVIQTPSNQI